MPPVNRHKTFKIKEMDEFDIQYTTMADDAIDCATMLAEERNHAFVTPEHLLYELIVQEPFVTAIDWSGMDAGALEKGLTERLSLMPIKAANAKSVMSFQMLELRLICCKIWLGPEWPN